MVYIIGEIEATERNATRVIEIVRTDLGRAGLDAVSLDKYANPDDEIHVSDQLDLLSKHPEQYIGATDESERLDGYAKIADWRYGDEAPFQSPSARLVSRALGRLGIDRGSDAVGIFGLALSDEVSEEDRLPLFDDMVAECVRLANGREIYIPQYPGDPALSALKVHGFESTGRSGSLFETEQTLFRRPPANRL
jgi:hypothetical protein